MQDALGYPSHQKTQERVTVICSSILESYRKKGFQSRFKHLFDTLYQLDSVCEAFDLLNVPSTKMSQQLLWQALESLDSLKFVPSCYRKIEFTSEKHFQLDKSLQSVVPDVLICKAKLCWKIFTGMKKD
jgi:hypothetical protein